MTAAPELRLLHTAHVGFWELRWTPSRSACSSPTTRVRPVSLLHGEDSAPIALSAYGWRLRGNAFLSHVAYSAMFRGVRPRMMTNATNSVVQFVAYEFLKNISAKPSVDECRNP